MDKIKNICAAGFFFGGGGVVVVVACARIDIGTREVRKLRHPVCFPFKLKILETIGIHVGQKIEYDN